MDDIVSDGTFCESTMTTPGSDVAFLPESTPQYSFTSEGMKCYQWLSRKWRCECLGQLYRRFFPLGYKKEFKCLLVIAWPVTVTTLFQQMMFVVTMMFVGHLGQLQLDATALGITMVNVAGYSVMLGLSAACDTLFPQFSFRFMAAATEETLVLWYKKCASVHPAEIGYLRGGESTVNANLLVLNQQLGLYTPQGAVIILLLLCLPCWAVLINIEHFLLATGQDPVIANMAGQFALCYIPILPANVVYLVLSKYLQAQSVVLPSCLILLLGNLLNAAFLAVFLLWLRLDFLGAGLSLGLSSWTVALMHIIYIKVTKAYKETWTGWSFQSLSEWKGFFNISLPAFFMVCLEWWSYEIFVILAGLLGGTQLAAHAIMFQIATVIFMLTLGLTVAVSVRIGNHLGEGNPDEAMNTAYVAISVVWLVAIVTGIVLIALKEVIPLAFTAERSVIETVATLIPLLAFYYLLDATQGVCSGILRGSGKQLFGASFNFISYYLIALPVGAVLMFKTYLQLEGLWTGIVCSLVFQSTAFLLKILFTDWIKESKLAQDRAGVTADEDDLRDKDLSPLQSPLSPSDENLVEADHIQLSTYSSLESVRSVQSDELTELQKTLLKRGVFVVCLLMVLGMGVIVNRVLAHLNTQSNCFLIHGKDLNLTLLYHDLHSNETVRNLTLNELQFLNMTYWFEKDHHGNASFTYCNGLVSERPVTSASVFNMSSFLFGFHHRLPHRPIL